MEERCYCAQCDQCKKKIEFYHRMGPERFLRPGVGINSMMTLISIIYDWQDRWEDRMAEYRNNHTNKLHETWETK